MKLVELAELSLRDWVELTGRELAPFGPDVEGLEWRPKSRYVGLRDDEGRLVVAGGVVRAEVEVTGERFAVAGIGGLIAVPEMRGRGFATLVMDGLRRLAGELGPDRAMLFCEPALVELYARRGYARIAAPVYVDQPQGRIEMPQPALWRALRPGATWPPGAVEVLGLPF